jgi:hypothetical protein
MAKVLGFEQEIDYDSKMEQMLKDAKERQNAATGVSQVKVAQKQAQTAEKIANKPTPAPVVAPPAAPGKPAAAPAARRQPTRPTKA